MKKLALLTLALFIMICCAAASQQKLTVKHYVVIYKVMTASDGEDSSKGFYFGPERVMVVRSIHSDPSFHLSASRVLEKYIIDQEDKPFVKDKPVRGWSRPYIFVFQEISQDNYTHYEKSGAKKLEFVE